MTRAATLLFFALLTILPGMANAREGRPSHCIALVENTPGLEVIWTASLGDPLPDHTVRLNFIDHSMYLIETPDGISAVTDYNGYIGATPFVPDVVTMNHSHSSHWTPSPDPAIPHVLKGWGDGEEPADHRLEIGDMLVRNVATNIRSRFGAGVEQYGNSIFIFEVAGLCIGHLGHLHHEPSPEQYAAIGRLDVVMAPVDGGMTLPIPIMIDVLKTFRSSIVLPMHAFSGYSLNAFLAGMADEFRIDIRDATEIEVSLRSLPSEPTVVVLRPRFISSGGDDF